MQEEYIKLLQERQSQVEKECHDLIFGKISHSQQANLQSLTHKMLVSGELDLVQVYHELSALEKADLYDFWKMEFDERPN